MRLPRVLRETTSFVIMDENIKTEGIFRVSARAQTVEILREAYDRGQKFIVWKEVNAVLAPSYWKKGTGDVGVEELDQAEGYELHVAAALIKLWYKELKEPIFPTSSYQALNKFYRSPEVLLEPPQLFAMLSENDEWSPISSRTSRKILIMHLLPLLSKVAESQDQNQMSPENLAVCFAPSLLCGPDPIEDLKISAIVRRILVAMIGHWKTGLAPMLHTDSAKFAESLRMSNAVEDREDPLEEAQTTHFDETQITGITLLDNDSSDEETESAPALPPRPRAATVDIGRLNGDIPTVPGFCRGSSFENSDEEIEKPPDLPSKARAMTFDRKCLNGSIPTISEFSRGSVSDTGSYDGTGHTRRKSSMVSNPVNSMIHSNNSVPQDSAPINVNHFNTTNPIRRKPAPSMLPLPRYSTIINDRPAAPEGIQYYNTVPLDSDERDEEDDINGLPSYEERVPIHKEPSHPVPPPPWNEPVIQRKPLPKSETGD